MRTGSADEFAANFDDGGPDLFCIEVVFCVIFLNKYFKYVW